MYIVLIKRFSLTTRGTKGTRRS